jgi:hypothetical protein
MYYYEMNAHVIMDKYYYPPWQRCTLAFNLTKFDSYDNTVKNFLESRLFFNMRTVLCVYVQFMIGSRKGFIRSLKDVGKFKYLGMT